MAIVDVSGERDNSAVLSIRVQTEGLPDANFSGSLLQNVSLAYRAYAVRRYGRKVDTRLVVKRIEISSLDIDLTAVAGALKTLWDQKELIGGFITHLTEAIGVLIGTAPPKLPKETKKLLQTTASAITEQNIINITFQNSGTINGNVSIGPEIAQAISDSLNTKYNPDSMKERTLSLPKSPSVALPTWEGASETMPKIASQPLALPRWDSSTTKSPTTGKQLTSVAQGPATDERTGELIAFFVNEKWYGQLEGSEVLLPLYVAPSAFPGSEIVLAHDKKYCWKGVVLTDREGAPCAVVGKTFAAL